MGQEELTFPLRVATRMTGLSAERLRAWEARYRAIDPIRTSGGARRYRASDLERLRLLRALVDAGHRIGDVAALDDAALREMAEPAAGPVAPGPIWDRDHVEPLFKVLERLDVEAARRLLEARQSELEPVAFARSFVLPLLIEVGLRWERGEMSIAAEHLVSSLLSTMLVSALHASRSRDVPGPVVVFATPPGERHEVGLFVAALTAAHAGAESVCIGADIPVEDLVGAVLRSNASVLALGFATLDPAEGERAVRALRGRLPARVELWLGGSGIPRCAPIRGTVRIENLDQLAALVASKRMAKDGWAA